MKRLDLIQHVEKQGIVLLREGGSHTMYVNRSTQRSFYQQATIFKTMNYLTDRVTVDERLCNGKPTIRGLGITVATVLEYLFAGDSKEEILANHSVLEPEDIDACMEFAMSVVNYFCGRNSIPYALQNAPSTTRQRQ